MKEKKINVIREKHGVNYETLNPRCKKGHLMKKNRGNILGIDKAIICEDCNKREL